MSEPVTIDASVFVNAFSPTETGSDASLAFIQKILEKETPMIVPTLLLVEVAAAIARKNGDSEKALQLAEYLGALPNILLVDVDESLARLSAETAARHKLRGYDSVYVAVSQRFATALVTLDSEQLERFPRAVHPEKYPHA